MTEKTTTLACFWMVLVLALAGCTAKDPVIPTPTVRATSTSVTLPLSATPEPGRTELDATSSPSPTAALAPTGAVSEPPTQAAAVIVCTVQPGDTLLGLAKAFGVPMAALQLQNGLGASTRVLVGQILEIPPQTGWENASPFWVIYEVMEGDTLFGIAQTYDLDVPTIQAVNGMENRNLLPVGDLLILPLNGLPKVPPPSSGTVPVPKFQVTPTPQVPTLAPPTAEVVSETPLPTEVYTATPSAPVDTPVASPPSDIATWPHEVARLINEVRAQHDLPPLVYNEILTVAAQGHANDCMQRRWCSHTGSDGSDIKERITRAGYGSALWGWAECWAQQQSPADAVAIWMDEVPPNDPHRRTLLSTHLSEIGVGVAETDWGYYFIADFGRPKSGS